MNQYLSLFRRLLLLIFLINFSCQDSTGPDLSMYGDLALQSVFEWKADAKPMVSAHRGGPAEGFPENCIETFAQTISKRNMILECDINMTKDGYLVLMHDDKVNRTTSGEGYVDELDLAVIRTLKLKDKNGKITNFSVPTLEEALQWAKGKTILSLDVKKGVPFEKVIDLVEKYEAVNSVTIIVYNANNALKIFELNHNLMISATIRNREEYYRLADAGVPDRNLIAFTGIRERGSSHYKFLHDKGIYCILGTVGNLDRRAERIGDDLYQRLSEKGVDIFATDRPIEVAKAIGLMNE